MYIKERAGYDVITDPYAGTFGQISINPGGGVIGPGGGTTRNGGGVIVGGGGGYVLDEGGGFIDPFYGFGADGPSLSGDNPFEPDAGGSGESTVDAEALKAALLECGASALLGGNAADCVWQKLKAIILAMPDVEAVLTTLAASSCSSALNALGLPSTVSSVVCGLGGSVWTKIQAFARDELNSIRAGRTTRDDRSTASGGGSVIREEGREPIVACASNDAFGPTVLGNPGDTAFRCPPGTGGVPGTLGDGTKILMARPARLLKPLAFFPKPGADQGQDIEKTGDEGGTAAPWYKNKWIWIGVGAVAVAGVGGVMVMRRRRRRG